MDSLTQVILGAAIGEAVAGRKIGIKAAFWGGIAGTIPDLDVFLRSFYHPLDAALVHRGFSHSFLFALIFGPIFAWVTHKIYRSKYALNDWRWLWFLGIITHPMLDMFTNYGTQFLWPLMYRITFNSVFVIDPLYTLPFMVFLILALRLKKEDPRRKRLNWIGIIYSTSYLFVGVIIKLILLINSSTYFEKVNIHPKETMVTPMPLTSFYWEFIGSDKKYNYIGYKSLFGNFSTKKEIERFPKNHHLIQNLKWTDKNRNGQINYLTNGFYSCIKEKDTIWCYDLRFGSLAPITDGINTSPLMGYGLLVKNKTVQKCFPMRRFGGVNGRTFVAYLKRIFNK